MPRRRKSSDAAVARLVGYVLIAVVLVPIWLWRQGKAGQYAAGVWIAVMVSDLLFVLSPRSDSSVRHNPSVEYTPRAAVSASAAQASLPTFTLIRSAGEQTPAAGALTEPLPSPAPQPTATQDKRTGTVNTGANLRNGLGTGYGAVESAATGQSVVIVGRDNGCQWYLLSTDQWILTSLVTLGSAPSPAPAQPVAARQEPAELGYGIVRTQSLNVRSGPARSMQSWTRSTTARAMRFSTARRSGGRCRLARIAPAGVRRRLWNAWPVAPLSSLRRPRSTRSLTLRRLPRLL